MITGKEYDMIKRKKLTKVERLKIYDRYNGHCAYCGQKIEYKEMQVDHLEPLRNGGKDEISNMICSCRSCNRYKDVYSLETLREQLSMIPQRLLRDTSTFAIAKRYGLITINDIKIKFYFEEIDDI